MHLVGGDLQRAGDRVRALQAVPVPGVACGRVGLARVDQHLRRPLLHPKYPSRIPGRRLA